MKKIEENRIVLKDEKKEDIWIYSEARIDEDGDLRIEGQDLGSKVENFWGKGSTEYEWFYTILKKDIPILIKSLGGKDGDDILCLIKQKCIGKHSVDIEKFIQEKNIPHEFWNEISD